LSLLHDSSKTAEELPVGPGHQTGYTYPTCEFGENSTKILK
jgi:hypothetical protein